MRDFCHLRNVLLLNLPLAFSPMSIYSQTVAPSVAAFNITATPGAADLVAKHPVKENEAPMRFEYVTSAHPGTWGKLDLKTNASSLSVEMQDGTISVLLPNGEKCFVATVNQTYRLTFSSVDAGTPKTVPTSAGSLLLLGSPQNNANDAQFVLITLPPTIDQKKTEHPPK